MEDSNGWEVDEDGYVLINQGKPEPPYFPIILPVPGIPLKIGQKVKCTNPKTRKTTKGTVTEHLWVIDWEDPPRGFLFKCWGVEPKLLRKVLEGMDPAFERDNWARVILIRE